MGKGEKRLIETWWNTQDVRETGGIIPTVAFVIKCSGCGTAFEAQSLRKLPESCPECGKENKRE